MRLKRLKLKNIRSYKEEEIIFPEGSILLSGDIGSGKSSILMAIEYALFGLQPGQRGSALLRNKNEVGEVLLELEIGNKEIIIERKLRRGAKNVSNEYAAISINGEKIECAITELKTKIISLLGYPQEFIKRNNILYTYTVYTPQEEMKQIILEDPETRLNILRHIFGVEKYKKTRENLLILINYLKEEVKTLQAEIKTIALDKEDLSKTKEIKKSIKEKISAQEIYYKEQKLALQKAKEAYSEIEQKIKEKLSLENEVEKAGIMLFSKKEQLESIKKEIEEVKTILKETDARFDETMYKKVLENISLLAEEIKIIYSKMASLNGDIKALDQIQSENLTNRERIFKIDICPTCLQDVPDSHKNNILNQAETAISASKKKRAEIEYELKKAEALYFEKSKEKELFEKERLSLEIKKSNQEYIKKTEEKQKNLEKTKEHTLADILMIEKHTQTLKESILKFSQIEQTIKKRSTELEEALEKERNSEIILAKLKKEDEMLAQQISSLQERITEKEKIKVRQDYILSLMHWLSTSFSNLIDYIERNILLQVRKEFSLFCNRWFHMLASEEIDIQLDETFSPIIIQGGIEMDYAFLSGGERTAVALAYRLALHQTVNTFLSKIFTKDILILDEPTDGFSETQIDKMGDVFRELTFCQLIIVSHEPRIEGFVNNVLKVTKENNISKITSHKL